MAHTFRIYCSASEDHSLAIVDGEVVLAKADLRDDRQVWYKDLSYGGGITDEAGSPAFALVNRSTGEALRHPYGFYHPVRATSFDPLHVDDSILWAESEDAGDGYFRRIHKFNNTEYVFHHKPADPRRNTNCYVFDHELADHHRRRAVAPRDGAHLVLSLWNGSRNQLWRMAPQRGAAAPEAPEHARRFRILCQSGEGLSVTVRDGAVVLATADHQDERQCWVQSFRNTGHVTDEEGHRAFALVNWATGKALMHKGHGDDELVQLAGHSPDSVDVALLWTQSDDLGEGFHGLRAVNDVGVVLDAAKGTPDYGGAHDGTPIIVFPWHDGPNQKWKLLPFN